jgi:ribonuclease T1
MLKNYSQLLLGILVGLLIGIFIGKQFLVSSPKNVDAIKTTTDNNKRTDQNRPQNPSADDNSVSDNDDSVPQKALDVLKYVRENGRAMDGYVGGRVFSNREKLLPFKDDNGNPMQYQEWDVNPKVEGKNRGAQRLVTSRNGRAWYTGDHYRTFIEIK